MELGEKVQPSVEPTGKVQHGVNWTVKPGGKVHRGVNYWTVEPGGKVSPV